MLNSRLVSKHFAAISAAVLLMGTAATVVSPAYAADATCQGQAATIVATADGEYLQGSEDADVIVVGNFDQVDVDGNGGNDIICATAGHTTVLNGGPGNDVLVDRQVAGAVEDYYRTTLLGGEAGNDEFIGGPDTELSYEGSESAVAFDLPSGTVVHPGGNDLVDGIRWLIGSDHADTFRGSSGSDYYLSSRQVSDEGDEIATGAGDDFVLAAAATVHLGAGEDRGSVYGGTMSGGAGEDTMTVSQKGTANGGPGRDRVAADVDVDDGRGPGPIRLHGGPGNDVLVPPVAYSPDAASGEDLGDCPKLCLRAALHGGAGTDTLDLTYVRQVVVDLRAGRVWVRGGRTSITAVENVRGSSRRDVIRGDGRANRFDGNGGDDLLVGRGGPDRLNGGPGRDRAEGGPGRDRCVAERKSSC